MLRGMDRYVVPVLLCFLLAAAGLDWYGGAAAAPEPRAAVFRESGTQSRRATPVLTLREAHPRRAEKARPEHDPRVPMPEVDQAALWIACGDFGVDRPLALAVIQTESGFDAEAVNGDCVGYMQIKVNERTLAFFDQTIGADPRTEAGNLRCGVYMLGQGIRDYGDQAAALTVYRWGAETAAGLGFRCDYSDLVLEQAETWRGLLAADGGTYDE